MCWTFAFHYLCVRWIVLCDYVRYFVLFSLIYEMMTAIIFYSADEIMGEIWISMFFNFCNFVICQNFCCYWIMVVGYSHFSFLLRLFVVIIRILNNFNCRGFFMVFMFCSRFGASDSFTDPSVLSNPLDAQNVSCLGFYCRDICPKSSA